MTGVAHLFEVLPSARRLLEAELELAEKPAEQLAARQRHFAFMKKVENLAEGFHKGGELSEVEYQDIRAARMGAEINLLRAGGDPTKAGEEEAKKEKERKPVKSWSGRISNDQAKEAPANGYLVSEKGLARLWKSWGIKEKLPRIDFARELVLVATANGEGVAFTEIRVEEKGSLAWAVKATGAGTPDDAAYQIITIRRAGIRNIRGRVVNKE
jgi:hypothetical protein